MSECERTEKREHRVTVEPKYHLPTDLSRCLSKRVLVGVVLEAVKSIDEKLLRPVASTTAGCAFQPRLLLALLTYCYAVGICSSQDVERTLHEDVTFRFLCGQEFPDWHLLRHFRRSNRELILRCLTDTVRSVWSLVSSGPEPGLNREHTPAQLRKGPDTLVVLAIEQDAEQRLDNAVLMDTTDLDE